MILLFAGRLIPSLSSAWGKFKTGTLWRSYVKANPLESARVDTYWQGGTLPSPHPKTVTGQALTEIAAHERGDIIG